jgi:hypothetical protein
MAKLADAIHFDYIEELCDEILDKFDCDEDIQVSVIGKYKEMKTFLKEFMKYDNVDFDCIELHDPECNKCDKEYIVDITNIEGNISFYCVPCYEDGRYFRFDGDVLYLLDGTKQAVLNTCEYDEMYFVIIGEDECECGECSDNDDKKIHIQVSTTVGNDRVGWVPIKIEMSGNEFDTLMDEVFGFWHMPFMF